MIRPALITLFAVGFTILAAHIEHNRAVWDSLAYNWGNVALAFLMVAGIAVVVEAVCRPWPIEGGER